MALVCHSIHFCQLASSGDGVFQLLELFDVFRKTGTPLMVGVLAADSQWYKLALSRKIPQSSLSRDRRFLVYHVEIRFESSLARETGFMALRIFCLFVRLVLGFASTCAAKSSSHLLNQSDIAPAVNGPTKDSMAMFDDVCSELTILNRRRCEETEIDGDLWKEI